MQGWGSAIFFLSRGLLLILREVPNSGVQPLSALVAAGTPFFLFSVTFFVWSTLGPSGVRKGDEREQYQIDTLIPVDCNSGRWL